MSPFCTGSEDCVYVLIGYFPTDNGLTRSRSNIHTRLSQHRKCCENIYLLENAKKVENSALADVYYALHDSGFKLKLFPIQRYTGYPVYRFTVIFRNAVYRREFLDATHAYRQALFG